MKNGTLESKGAYTRTQHIGPPHAQSSYPESTALTEFLKFQLAVTVYLFFDYFFRFV